MCKYLLTEQSLLFTYRYMLSKHFWNRCMNIHSIGYLCAKCCVQAWRRWCGVGVSWYMRRKSSPPGTGHYAVKSNGNWHLPFIMCQALCQVFLYLYTHLILIKSCVGGNLMNPILQIWILRQSLVTRLGNSGAGNQIQFGFWGWALNHCFILPFQW